MAGLRAFVEVHDWNGDGRLSGPEVAIAAQRDNTVAEADHAANRVERDLNWTAAGFANLDHNRDQPDHRERMAL